MAGQTFEEVLRIVLETQGEQGLDDLREALAKVGDVSDDTIADTRKLIDQLNDLNATAGKAARFGQMADDFARTSEAMDNAQNATYQLTLRMGELSSRGEALAADHKAARAEVERLGAAMKEEGADADALGKAHKAAQAEVKRLGAELRDNGKEIKATATAQQAARAEMEKLDSVYGKQVAALDKLDKELADSGRSTKDLGKLQGTLAAEIADATGDIQKQAAAMQAEAKAAAALRQRLDEGDEAFRKFAQAGTASAEALRRYKEGADGAAAGSKRLASESGRLSGIFSGLRSLIGPVLAYLSFSTAIQGVKNLAGVASAAENARRSLSELYGSQDAGTKAYESLRTMARENGIAFADLLTVAKKLKAFGLDPLNGSLQALVDQNAAVGGSQDDLAGKVLALGQAWTKQRLMGQEVLQLAERGVPVWDLLSQATGRSVTELQKLGEQGKLGRDVIRQLYEEIGRQSSGAAQRGLSSLSGLLVQAGAAWQNFLQKVADSGVTDYFKRQLQSLLGSAGSLDALAKRVAASIIGLLEGLRKLGSQLAPIGAAIGNLTLFLAKHANAVLGVVKAWALFRAVEIAAGFAKVTEAVIASTTAVVAQNAALATTARSGAAVGGLSGLFGALTGRIAAAAGAALQLVRVLGIPAAITASVIALAKAYEGINEANLQRWQSEAGLRAQQQDQLKLGRQLQQLYRDSADVAVQSGDAVSKMTRDQAADYRYALEQARVYYRGVINEAIATGDALKQAAAKERFDELGQAIAAVKARLQEMASAADPRGLNAFVDAAVDKFDDLVTKSKDAKQSVAGIFDGIDFRQADGIVQAGDILTQLAARGRDAGAAIRAELSAALGKVAQDDLPALKAQAEAAMAAGVTGAREFSDAVSAINLQRLGVDIEAIRTGFSAAGRTAVDAFRGAVDEVDKLGLTIEQRSRAIAQAFDTAFRQTSTQAELEALKASLQDALSAGDIGFVEFQRRVVETDEKLAQIGGTGKQMGEDVASGASNAASAMSSMSSSMSSASSAASSTGSSVDDMGRKLDETSGAAKTGQGVMKGYALAVRGLNDEAIKAMISLNRLRVDGMTASGSVGDIVWGKSIEYLTHQMQEQYDTLQKVIASTEEQAAQYDENAKRLAALRQQYKWLSDDELQRLIDAEDKLKQGRERAAEDAKRQADETAAAYEKQRKAAEEAEAARIAAGTIAGRDSQSAQATADVAERVIDSAVAATERMSKVTASAELTLRVIAEPTDGVRIQLTKQQMYEISSTVVRLLKQSKSLTT